MVNTFITIPKSLPANSSRYAKEKVRIKFRRLAAIEPIIGHLKHEHRMEQNFLKGLYGDFVNCVLAAAGFNLNKMLRKIASYWDSIIRFVYTIIYALFSTKLKKPKIGFLRDYYLVKVDLGGEFLTQKIYLE